MKKVVPKVKRILNMSLKQAKLYEDWEVKIEHIMIALINDYNNNAVKILEEMDIDIDMLHKKIEKFEQDLFLVQNIENPLKSISSYKLKELQDIATKLDIELKRKDGQKNKTKKSLYSEIQEILV